MLPPLGVEGDCTGLDEEKLNGDDGVFPPPSILVWGLFVGALRVEPNREGVDGAPSPPLPRTVVGPHVTIVALIV